MTAPMGTSPASRARRASLSAKPIKKLSFSSESRKRSAVVSPFVAPFATLRFAIVYKARQNAKANGTDANSPCQGRHLFGFDVKSCRVFFVSEIHKTSG